MQILTVLNSTIVCEGQCAVLQSKSGRNQVTVAVWTTSALQTSPV